MARKPPKGKSLAEVNPKLSKEWHPTKNNNLTPYDVSSGTSRKVWWKCDKGVDHEWESRVSSRSDGTGCPICRGLKVVLSNCLATLDPEVAKEWHPTKNGDLTPYDVSVSSGKKVWWKCDKGDDHEWLSQIASRSRGNGCSVCYGRTVVKSNCLATLDPELAKEWHPTKNGELTPFDVTPGSNKKVWWKCEEGDDHEWFISPDKRKETDCPICVNQKIVLSNCLATTHPEIAKQWHPTKNKGLTPYDVVAGANNNVWWKCNKGDDHEWETSPNFRTGKRRRNCPICIGQKTVLSNCLATLNPQLAKQWHPTKNGNLTPFDVTTLSSRKIWWQCKNGIDHVWKTTIANRAYGKNCPYCDLTPQSKQELTITFELIPFFKDINPKGFKTRVDGKLWTIDIYIPQLNLGIEFDGSYWHKDKRALDKLKTKQLKKEGFDIIRVRETPLKKINRTDVISKQPFNGKEVANKVLKQIMKMYDLDAKKVRKIENYLDKKELQNEKGLEKYIDMILTEKAEKNNA